MTVRPPRPAAGALARRARVALLALVALAGPARAQAPAPAPDGPRFTVTFAAERSRAPIDGRLLLLISADTAGEPRTQVSDAVSTAQVFGVDVEAWRPGETRVVDAAAFGYPI